MSCCRNPGAARDRAGRVAAGLAGERVGGRRVELSTDRVKSRVARARRAGICCGRI